MPRLSFLAATAAVLLTLHAAGAGAAQSVEITYTLVLEADSRSARASITLGKNAALIDWMDLELGPRYSEPDADGSLEPNGARLRWTPPPEGGSFRYRVRIDELQGGSESYRGYFADDWAVFRAEGVIPRKYTSFADGTRARSRLVIEAPAGWSVETPYARRKGGGYGIHHPETKIDTPNGWIIAGRLGTRRDEIAGVDVVVSAPLGYHARRMDLLAFLNFTLPVMRDAFGDLPRRILLASAPDPMWRGGLSAPQSLFLHLDRPFISENGTSTVLHELTHVVTRITGAGAGDDWIAEGLAEFYAIELLYRAGGMTDARLEGIKRGLRAWSKDVRSLRVPASTGAVTARAVLLLMDVDAEIRAGSDQRRSLDDVTRLLMAGRRISTTAFVQIAESTAQGTVKALNTELLLPAP